MRQTYIEKVWWVDPALKAEKKEKKKQKREKKV
jgi:hypothetical protein